MESVDWYGPRIEDSPAIDVSLVRGYKLAKGHMCRVSGRQSVHCQQAKANMMISFGGNGDIELLDANNEKLPKGYKGMLDVFITRRQAEILHRDLGRRLQWERELDEEYREERQENSVGNERHDFSYNRWVNNQSN